MRLICLLTTLPIHLQVDLNSLIFEIANELVGLNGVSSFTSYKENGISWARDKSGVSQSLLERIPVICGTVPLTVVTEEEV